MGSSLLFNVSACRKPHSAPSHSSTTLLDRKEYLQIEEIEFTLFESLSHIHNITHWFSADENTLSRENSNQLSSNFDFNQSICDSEYSAFSSTS